MSNVYLKVTIRFIFLCATGDKDKFSSAHDDEEEFETKMGILKALFPNLSEDELVDHLISNNMNISVTVQQLFDATTFTPTKPKKKKKKAKTQYVVQSHNSLRALYNLEATF